MFTNFRYWMSANLLDAAIWILPDDYTKSRMRMGIGIAADMMIQEIDAYENGEEEFEDETIH